MGLKSTTERYGAVAIAIHWVSALAILGLLVSGFIAAGMDDAAAKAGILRIHAVVGVTILVLTVLRILWWWLLDRRPAELANLPRWQAIGAHAVHGLLYLSILVMVASGIGMVALSGAADALFGSAPLPDFTEYAPRIPHGATSRLMLLLLALHIGAALYHQFRGERILARMGLGR